MCNTQTLTKISNAHRIIYHILLNQIKILLVIFYFSINFYNLKILFVAFRIFFTKHKIFYLDYLLLACYDVINSYYKIFWRISLFCLQIT